MSWILSNLFIRRDKDHAFDTGLGDQHAIEWIFVNWRQIQSRQGVLARDSKFMPAIVDEGASESLRLDMEIFATERTLDRHFPKARRAEPYLRAGIFKKATSLLGQFLWLTGSPQQKMGVH